MVATWLGIAALSASHAAADAAMTFSLDEVGGSAAAVAEPAAEAKGVPADAVEKALGPLRWGMTRAEVLKLLKARVRAEFQERIRVERDILRQDGLYKEAAQRAAAIERSLVVFNGRKTGWDASQLADEFRHGSDEVMLVADTAESRDHYFFIGDKLWKWYRELKAAAPGEQGHEQIVETLVAQFGRARSHVRDEGGGTSYPGMRWSDARTQVTAFRRGGDSCLVFEARDAVAKLATLRRNALPREQRAGRVLEGIFMSAEEREAWRADR
jgi:hypothetical protein